MLLFYDFFFFKKRMGHFLKKGWDILWVKHLFKLSSQMYASVSEIIEITHQKELDNFIKLQ